MAAEGDIYHQEHEQEQQLVIDEEQRLKYLGFVQVAAIHAVMSFMNIYLYAKEKSGPLKQGVENVEGAVKTVVGPVYDKFHGVPIEVLKFVDRKVDESVTNLDRRVPPAVKHVQQAGVKEAASEIARTVYVKCEPKAKELYSKYEPVAKELYSKYEPKAEQCAASAWRRLNQLPVFPHVARVVVPTAAFCADKYNQTVMKTAEKGFKVSSYMPLVPTEKIAKVFADPAC